MSVDNQAIAQIKQGLLVLLGIERGDSEQQANRLLERVLGYRIFGDTEDKMNLSLTDVQGGLLLVPQFTLAANTAKGMRPSFTPAAAPTIGKTLFDYLVTQAQKKYHTVETGRFGADMQVSLTNDGPVTFWLQVSAN